jgi:hypothetical protein
MPDTPPQAPKGEEYTACPHCTMQIPADATTCPHCQQDVLPPESPKRRRLFSAGRPDPSALWDRYGKVVMVAVPILLAVLVLLLVYQRGVVHRVKVMPNSSLPIRVEKEVEGDALVLRGTVTNEGDDIPDLSLRSVAVIVDFVYRNGRREKKTVFPKTQFRGEGALLRGETGTFEVAGPAKEIREVILRTEVLDLGMGRKLIRPRRR